MACGSPRPIWYLRDAVALRRPRRVCNPMWQLKTGRPAGPRPGHQERRTVPLEFRAIHFSFEFPQMLPVLSRKRRHHHQGGCAQRPAGPTQTSSFVSAELLCHRQDSQCFCTSLQAPKFSATPHKPWPALWPARLSAVWCICEFSCGSVHFPPQPFFSPWHMHTPGCAGVLSKSEQWEALNRAQARPQSIFTSVWSHCSKAPSKQNSTVGSP